MSVRSLRRGSIAASRLLASATATGLILPGTSGNDASTPDSAANSFTGNFDLRTKISLNDWTPSQRRAIVSKFGSYLWGVTPGGEPYFQHSVNGSDYRPEVPGTALGLVDGSVKWLRVTFNKAAGQVLHYISDDGVSWTSNGGGSTLALAAADTSNAVILGGSGPIIGYVFPGTIHYTELRNDIDGTVVSRFDPSSVTIAGTRDPSSLVSDTGETWTVNGSAWDWV